MYPVKIASVDDFIRAHYDKPIFCQAPYRDGSITLVAPSYDLMTDVNRYYLFQGATSSERWDLRSKINTYLNEHLYQFKVEDTNMFFWPNTNMFSASNEERNVPGCLLYLLDEYKKEAPIGYRVTFTVEIDASSSEDPVDKAAKKILEDPGSASVVVKNLYAPFQ